MRFTEASACYSKSRAGMRARSRDGRRVLGRGLCLLFRLAGESLLGLDEIGRASVMKMVYAAATKGSWTLWTAILLTAARTASSNDAASAIWCRSSSRDRRAARLRRRTPVQRRPPRRAGPAVHRGRLGPR